MSTVRLSFDALAAYVGDVYGEVRPCSTRVVMPFCGRSGRGERWELLCPASAVAVALGGSNAIRRATERWKHAGLTLEAAERVCVALRCTPWDIWRDEYAAAIGGELVDA